VIPIVAITAGATCWLAYNSYLHLFENHDVLVTPSKRSAPVAGGSVEKYSIADGQRWQRRVSAFYRHKDNGIENLSVFQAFTWKYWQQRWEVASNPREATASGKTLL